MNRSSVSLTLSTALLATTGLSLAVLPSVQAASSIFSEQSVNAAQFVVMAAPRNDVDYNLVVLEQKSANRDCWTESNGIINPLLLNFDFSGICGRATDSNGYSIRMAGEDLGLQYSLRLVDQGNYVALLAAPNRRNQSTFEIGRTQSTTKDFLNIELNPGWNLSRRVYDGKPLGHIYFSNELSLANTIAAAPSVTTAASPKPTTQPTVTQSIARPITRPVVNKPVNNDDRISIGQPLPQPPLLPGGNLASAPVLIPVEQAPVIAEPVAQAPEVVIAKLQPVVSPLVGEPYYAELNALYQEILNRPVDSSGLTTYSKRLEQGKDLDWVSDRLRNSQEGKTIAINRLYQEVLGREVDPSGLRTYRKRLDRGWTLSQVRSRLINSSEGRQRLANR